MDLISTNDIFSGHVFNSFHVIYSKTINCLPNVCIKYTNYTMILSDACFNVKDNIFSNQSLIRRECVKLLNGLNMKQFDS